jgi:two-component system sensor histidine kinase DesK
MPVSGSAGNRTSGSATVEETWRRTTRTRRLRALARGGLALIGMVLVTADYLGSDPDTRLVPLVLLGALVGFVLGVRLALVPGALAPGLVPTRRWWVLLAVLLIISVALQAIGGSDWLALSSLAGAAAGAGGGRTIGLTPVFVLGTAIGLIEAAHGDGSWNAMVQAGVVLLSGLFGAQAWQRAVMLEELRATRERLAIVAASRERSRIGRDLHDLLGRTLTTATVKLELAQRLLTVDVDRARTEIVESQGVIQDSLDGVREAVAGYRQPTLAEELQSAPELLRICGIDCELATPGGWHLPAAVDSALAWVVREAATNVARHSGASRCQVDLRLTAAAARLDVVDNGTGLADNGEAHLPSSTGLAGLADRLAEIGGSLTAGPAEPRGFRLSAEVPVLTGNERMDG